MREAASEAEQIAADKKHYEIFLGDLRETWDRPHVIAKEIVRSAGFKEPDRFVLEALERPGGSPVAEFESTAVVDLAEEHRKFFRVTPGGGGRS